jgi:hypothetical protein
MNRLASTHSHYTFPANIPEAQTGQVKRKMFDLSYASLSPHQKLDIY